MDLLNNETPHQATNLVMQDWLASHDDALAVSLGGYDLSPKEGQGKDGKDN